MLGHGVLWYSILLLPWCLTTCPFPRGSPLHFCWSDKSGSPILIATHLGKFFVGKWTSPDSVKCTPPSLLIASNPSRRSKPSSSPLTIRISRCKECMRLVRLVPWPLRICPFAVITSTFWRLHQRHTDVLISVLEHPVSTRAVHCPSSTSTRMTGYTTFFFYWRWRLFLWAVFPDILGQSGWSYCSWSISWCDLQGLVP